MRQKGVYLSVGLSSPRQFIFDGGEEVIEYFGNKSTYSKFDEDLENVGTRFVSLPDLGVFHFLENVDGGLCGNYCSYLFEVVVESDQDLYSHSELKNLKYIEFYEEGNTPKYVYESKRA